ncbi:MAG: hypothetical protein IPK83_07500 [Planctomycetes bacterium]|nr:hypothetical protein [Planctomycetota bacterium]
MTDHTTKTVDPINGLRAFLALDAVVRLALWAGSLSLTTACITWLGDWPTTSLVRADFRTAFQWFGTFTQFAFLFNVWYVLLLIVLRLPIPTPKQGKYSLKPGKPPDRQLVWACFIASLTKARYEPPFPGFLVHHVASLPPFCWVYNAVFGPKTKSCNVTDVRFLDPFGIEVGKNVVFGLGAIISAHAQGRDDITIRKTVIEDNVIFGGNVMVYDGCTIKQGAVILGGAALKSNTVVGENEVWGGIPAKKLKTLPPYGQLTAADDEISV